MRAVAAPKATAMAMPAPSSPAVPRGMAPESSGACAAIILVLKTKPPLAMTTPRRANTRSLRTTTDSIPPSSLAPARDKPPTLARAPCNRGHCTCKASTPMTRPEASVSRPVTRQ